MDQRLKKMKTKKNQIKEGEDRLSSLPDSILVSILNCLPIEFAAITSVLSRRWHHLWTQPDSIHFPPTEKIDKYKNYEYFIATVDHIISKLTTSKISELSLDIHCVDDPKSSTFMVPWISKICRLKPEAIKLIFRDISAIVYNIQLPSCLFQTQSLFSLTLFGCPKYEYTLPADGINLPNLRDLHLCLHDSHLSFLGTLFKSCPLLEILLIFIFNKGHGVSDIIVPNLKYLSIGCLQTDFKFVIDAPKLEEICIMGRLAFFHFVNNPISLRKLTFHHMHDYGNDVDYPRKVGGLFQHIFCVSSLDLWESGPYLLSTLNGIALPIFPNIIYLSLCSTYMDESSQVPLGWLCKLKKVKLSKVVGNGFEMKFLEHILSNARVLEELHVSFGEVYSDGREPQHDQAGTKYKFCTDIFLLRKSSLRCVIKFFGKRITASSDDFRNGVLTNQTLE